MKWSFRKRFLALSHTLFLSRTMATPPPPAKPNDAQLSSTETNITSVFINRIRRKQSHVEYVIEVTGKTASWHIYRRYQQFRDLHAALSKLCSLTDAHHTSKGVLPVLPGTSWIRVTSDDVDLVEKRRLHLEIYLQQLLVPSNRFYRDCPELRAFMHHDEMPIQYKNSLSRTVPGVNAPLEYEPSGSVDRIFDDDCEEDQRHMVVVASRPSSAVVSAIEPSIPKMDDWSTSSRGHNDIAAISGAPFAAPAASGSAADAQRVPLSGSLAGAGAQQVPYELCKECGHREEVDYDVDEWVANGTCRNCGQITEHELIVPEAGSPTQSPIGTAAAAAAAAASSGSGGSAEDQERAAARRNAAAAGVPMENLLDAPGTSAAGAAAVSPTSRNANSGGGGERSRSPGSPASGEDAPPPEVIQQALQTFDARCDISLSDFELITTLGRGTFGKVMKARYRPDGRIYAIKVLSKSMVHQKRMVDYVREEKGIMAFLPPHPFIVQLHFAFQTDHHLYFVMDFLTGGELYAHMQPLERLPLHAARFYAAELLLALEHIHRYDVAHRDLKPENIVLGADGHLFLTDFGLARSKFSQKRRFSFVGSAEYLSPEVVRTEGQTKAIDWWGFGCMVYEFLTGKTPFHAHTARDVYAGILNRTIEYNKAGMTPEAQDLISKLLDKNPRSRLQDPAKIKRHPFFAGINWDHVYQKKLKPPFVPDLSNNDTKYFSKDFTSEWASIPAAANSTRASIERLAARFSNFRRIADNAAGGGASLASRSLSHLGDGGRADSTTPRSEGPDDIPGTTPTTAASASGRTPATTRHPSTVHGRPLPATEALYPLVTLPDGDGSAIVRAPREIQLKHVDPDEFVGVWRLLRVEMISTLGQVVFPWGAEVAGQLIFTGNGLFSTQICPIKRLKFRGLSKPTRDEMVEAFQSYVASFGNFFVVPGKPFIVQRASAALSPSLIGVLQKRYFDLDTERKLLKLMSPLYRGEGNTLVFSSMTWSRVA
jgi:serine/threonine protein kinase